MTRRALLASLFGAAFVQDPERLLWIPGRKKIFIPPLRFPTPRSEYERVFQRYLLATHTRYERLNAAFLERSFRPSSYGPHSA